MTGISVVLPTNIFDPLLQRAVASVLRQRFTDFELLVVDDRLDPTPEPTSRLAQTDRRIRILRSEQRGVVPALNAGIQAAGSAYVAVMHADDVAMPTRLGRLWAFAQSHPSTDVIGSRALAVDLNCRPLYPIDVPLHSAEIVLALLYAAPALIHPAVMLRRTAIIDVGGYQPALPGAEDLDLWLRLLPTARFANVPERLLLYTVHPAQTSQRTPDDGLRVARRYETMSRFPANSELAAQLPGPTQIDQLRDLELGRLTAVGTERLRVDLDLASHAPRGAFDHYIRDDVGGVLAHQSPLRLLAWTTGGLTGTASESTGRARLPVRQVVSYARWVWRVRTTRLSWRLTSRRGRPD